jgi:hypothetical protein
MKLKSIIFIALFAGLVWLARPSMATKHSVTFNQDIAPLFNQHCTECHRPGEAAPFSTMRYQDVRPWAKSIRERVASRNMPPWHADPATGEWANDRRLAQADIDKVVAWVNAGAPEGSDAAPAAPVFAEGWRIGKPDLVVTMAKPYTLAAGANDAIQDFKLPITFKEDVYVAMAEARPGNRRIVHHLIVSVVPPQGKAASAFGTALGAILTPFLAGKYVFAEKDGLSYVKANAPVFDDGCGLRNGGGGATNKGTDQLQEEFGGSDLCAYAPGIEAETLTPGSYKKIPAGSTLWMQAHYSNVFGSSANDAPQSDQSSIGLVIVKDPSTLQREIHTGALFNSYFKIPAGADNHRVTACWTVPRAATLLTLIPHMHLRGKAMQYSARYPDGRTETLLNVPQWDFNWQTRYQFKKPLNVPAGTQLTLTAWYDNSSKNKFNPDANKAIRWGDSTKDEMMLGYVEYFENK